MFNLWGDSIIREAKIEDGRKLTQLLGGSSFSQRHMGWESPLSWLGKEPFYVLDAEGEMIAALACPPDDDGICWLRLFVSRAGYPPRRAWERLWPSVQEWINVHHPGLLVNSLLIKPEMEHLLSRAGFQEINQVVVLIWNSTNAIWPDSDGGSKPRQMEAGDLPRVYGIDQRAFDMIWRNSLGQLQAAYREAYSATVIEIDSQVAAYQISTVNPEGGHLARLAVDPAFHKTGLATQLVADLLLTMESRGIVEMSVNTQADNIASLDLYNKFGFKRLAEEYPVLQYDSGFIIDKD